MARAPKLVRFDGEKPWFSLTHAASRIGTTRTKLGERALAGEFVFQADEDGGPIWLLESEVNAARAARLAAKSAKPKPLPRPKTPAQQAAEWAKMSARNAKAPHDGPFTAMHLRLTLPDPKRDKSK